jgi:hypothetical protein
MTYEGVPNNYYWNVFFPGMTQTPTNPAQFPNKTNVDVPLVIEYIPDGGAQPEQLPYINISTDSGSIIGEFGLPYDPTKVGKGVRVGMVFKIDPSVLESNNTFTVQQVDNGLGTHLPNLSGSFRPKTDLVLSTGTKINMWMIPMPYYREGFESKCPGYW